MRNPLIYWACGASFLLAACSSTEERDQGPTSFLDRWSIIYKMEIQQGNIINQEMVDQLQPGMEKRQVRFILGTPLLVDTFHRNRWDYYYWLRQNPHPPERKHVAVYFDDNRLVRIAGDLHPQPEDAREEKPDLQVVSVPDYEATDKGIITRIIDALSWSKD